jgi:hypothetical protein
MDRNRRHYLPTALQPQTPELFTSTSTLPIYRNSIRIHLSTTSAPHIPANPSNNMHP